MAIGGGNMAGLPGLEHLVQAAEEAHEAGDDQGMHGVGQPGRGAAVLRAVAQGGDRLGEGGVRLHVGIISRP